MAIRRFREHIADQNWFAVLLDIGIVVIGVFLGIQASNWNAARTELGEARTYRTLIVDDLKANEAELLERIEYYLKVRDHALATMDAVDSRGQLGEAFLIGAYQASQVSPIRMERSAYDEMIAGGMAKNFGQPAVRRQLSSYYAGTERLEAGTIFSTGYRDHIRREMSYAVQRRLRERCSDRVNVSANGLEDISLPVRCDLQLPPGLVLGAAMDLRGRPEFAQELTRHIGDLDVKIARFRQWLHMARITRQTLEKLTMS